MWNENEKSNEPILHVIFLIASFKADGRPFRRFIEISWELISHVIGCFIRRSTWAFWIVLYAVVVILLIIALAIASQ